MCITDSYGVVGTHPENIDYVAAYFDSQKLPYTIERPKLATVREIAK